MPPNADPNNPAKLLRNASQALDMGRPTLAEILAREALDEHPGNPRAHFLIASIAESLGRPDLARTHYELSLEAGPTSETRKRLKALPAPAAPAAPPAPGERGLLLIKPWGAGFWSDVNHVLGQILLAEIEGRTPLVYWGEGSLYRDPGVDNAWDTLFEPISDATLDDVLARPGGYYPPKWNADNLRVAECNKWEGRGSRVGLELLGRPERVVVSDFNLRLFSLLPWIPAWHPLHALDVEAVYRDLASRYLRPRAEIVEAVDKFAAQHFQGRHTLAVHVRATDKVVEDPRLPQINAEYAPRVDRFLEHGPDRQVFLLTDGQAALQSFRERYGDRLIATESIRSDSQIGIHFQREHPRSTIAREVLADVLLATRCDEFLGFGNSSVSTFVYHLKDWAPEACTLLGGIINHHGRNPYVYATNRIPRPA